MDTKVLTLLEGQVTNQRKALFWTRLIALICLVMCAVLLVSALTVKAKLDSAMEQYNSLAGQLEDVLDKLDDAADQLGQFSLRLNDLDIVAVTENLSVLSDQLADIQWKEMAENLRAVSGQLTEIQWQQLADNIDQTAVIANESLVKAMEAIDALDIAELNKAINELHTVIEPLANIVQRLS